MTGNQRRTLFATAIILWAMPVLTAAWSDRPEGPTAHPFASTKESRDCSNPKVDCNLELVNPSEKATIEATVISDDKGAPAVSLTGVQIRRIPTNLSGSEDPNLQRAAPPVVRGFSSSASGSSR